ncbi:MAG TPA: RhuM family protein [Alphaproteobacteria bacterium]|nr:RhuM family protein [Alphaproteobacteria bacterium]
MEDDAIEPSDEPVHLVEDPDSGSRFLIYGTDRGIKVELRYEGDTLWMTQAQMAQLFGVNVPAISKHISNIYAEGELSESSTFSKMETVRTEGERRVGRIIDHYNLDMIVSVGYRVSSKQGTMFRKWATDKLVRFATKGFVVDVERLRNPEENDRLRELRDVVRDIRASEANVYAELRRICAMCQDYDPQSSEAREFYQRTQAKLFWAVTSHTPSMLIVERARASLPNMGLQTWLKDEIRQQDVLVAKNYLSENEIRELNRLTTILLDIFEDQLDLGKLTLMSEATLLLDKQLRNLNRSVLNHGGSVKHATAEAHAKLQYQKFDEGRRETRRYQADRELAELKASERSITRRKKP